MRQIYLFDFDKLKVYDENQANSKDCASWNIIFKLTQHNKV